MKKKVTMRMVGALLMVLAGFIVFSSCQRREAGRSNDRFGGPDNTGPIRINFVAENRFLRYTHATPLTMPDGRTIIAGDLKPFWQWIERRLGIQIQDVATQPRATEIIQTQSATGFRHANVFGGNSISGDLMRYGSRGFFHDLNLFIDDYMPYFRDFLAENPAIRQAITSYDGGIYFIPYIAEIGYLARVFLARHSWVHALLDGEVPLEHETATLTIAYTGYWKGDNARHATNVIVRQNEAAVNGVLDFATARRVMLDYIRETYPHLARPSDLFLGAGAQHDIDELAALWRIIRLAPNTLSRVTTGAVVPNANIVPYFFRLSTNRECLFRLANYFSGQRVFGSNTYTAQFFIDKNGELQFSLNQDYFLDTVLPHLRAFYTEGLIFHDFATLALRDNFRTIFFGGDLRPGNTNFGFMTFDFIPSTTAISLGGGVMQTDVEGILPPVTRIPGVTDDFVHFIENTRVIMPDGWSISAVTGGDKLRDTLRLFDFFWSPEGHKVQNFGLPEMIDEEPFINPEGIAFPRMNDWFHEQAMRFTNGDGSLFSRSFLGFNFPLGFSKSIGFEQQFTTEAGQRAWALHAEADVLSLSYGAENPFFRLSPPVFSMNSRLQRQLLGTNIGPTQVDMIFQFITTGVVTPDNIREAFDNGRITDFVEIHRDAFALAQEF